MKKVRIKERKICTEGHENILKFINEMYYIREINKENPDMFEFILDNCRAFYKDITNSFREHLGINNIISLGIATHKKTGKEVLCINIWDCDIDKEDTTRWYTIEEDEEGVYINV
ncbi:hypothetical protein PMX22_20125 [Clostridium butyricum]|jgi:hypothetical protein|uniref:hypothetical protein n=1 Tax=Clostridium butyricum TaxID=1492 RepID=UPI0020696C31|nr:hypothetical protein [Clostridium butyricum]MDB2162094.1 hypothetical protein [Clostridium butyricum]DAQ97610.1 MAG TPA: hypothetical protein [Caudoviricetes sp.]